MDCILSVVSEGQIYPNNKLPECKYGNDCYRKNPVHFEEFQHPNTSNIARFSTKNIFSYELLLQKINFIFDLSQFNTPSLFYYDDENDKIEVTSTIEWLELTSDNKNQILLFLSIKLKENYLKTCTHCKKQIQLAEKFRYECSTCNSFPAPFILCQQCENLNLDNNYHSVDHKFTKVYYQHDIFALRRHKMISFPRYFNAPKPFFPPSYYSQLNNYQIPIPPVRPVINLPMNQINNNDQSSDKIKELSEELAAIRKMISDLQLNNKNNFVSQSSTSLMKEEQIPQIVQAIPEEVVPSFVAPEENGTQSAEDERLVAHMMNYSQQMDQLLELGFSDIKQNLRLLRRHRGNVDRVLSVLCEY